MSNEHTKSKAEETQVKTATFAECCEQMMSACGPEMKQWLEACTSNTGEACSSRCGTQTKTETAEKA
ncbi:hypothetical protein ACFLTP_05525 [Chloroflexota bacterium]